MEGNYKVTPCTDVETYTSVLKEGVLHGRGQGIVTSKDGKGVATWTGQGVGRFTEPGKVSFRGSIFFRYLQHLREENCRLSITWWEFLNTR
jgi:hypothetical protein